jgi:hypothetical protein
MLLFTILSRVVAQNQITLTPVGDRRSILVAERTGRIHWSYGAVRGVIHDNYGGAPVVWFIDRNGVRDDFQIVAPELRHSTIRRVAAAPDGAVAVIGYGKTRFLARFSPDRAQVKVISLPPFSPYDVAVTSDGRMWTIGQQPAPQASHRNYDVALRGYDPSGELQVTRVIRMRNPRGEFSSTYDEESLRDSMLVAAGSRVVWLTSFGRYVELGASSQEALVVEPPSRFEFDKNSASLAVGPNDTYLAMDGEDVLAMWRLDLANRRWIPVELADQNSLELGTRLLGFDGNDLVMLDAGLDRGGFLTRWRRR